MNKEIEYNENLSPIEANKRIQIIRQSIMADGDKWRHKYPILANNNLIGMSILLFSLVGMIIGAYGYIELNWSAWFVIPFLAFFSSLSHELEHDLIHWQYFKNRKTIHHLMLFTVWLMRPGTINPWFRRKLHFLHHKTSGTEKDIEERGVSNGMKYGPLRFWVMMDTFIPNVFKVMFLAPKGEKIKRVVGILIANLPFGVISVFLWYGVIGFHGANLIADALGTTIIWSEWMLTNINWMTSLVIVWIAPFYLRSFSINVITSNMHYYGNVTNTIEETQVLNHPIFWPLQVFCFNFGSTHGIHHFVVKEPFYIRQLTVKAAHKVMRENGVRFNDFGTFTRANNYFTADQQQNNLTKV
jgi:fatty acid desaturase